MWQQSRGKVDEREGPSLCLTRGCCAEAPGMAQQVPALPPASGAQRRRDLPSEARLPASGPRSFYSKKEGAPEPACAPAPQGNVMGMPTCGSTRHRSHITQCVLVATGPPRHGLAGPVLLPGEHVLYRGPSGSHGGPCVLYVPRESVWSHV